MSSTGPLIDVHDLERTFVVRRQVDGRRRRRARARCGRSTTSPSPSTPARWSATSAPTAPASRRPIKMLTGILVPTGGTSRVAGLDPQPRPGRAGPPDRRRLRPAHDAVVGPAAARLLRAAAEDVPHPARPLPRQPRALRRAARPRRPARHPGPPAVASGQRMRGDITAALLHDPEILYLDEPTIGLDVVSKGRLREFLRALNAERGTTLVLTTHDLQDIEALCDRVIVIDHGTAVFDGTLGRRCTPRAARPARWWWTWSTRRRRSRSRGGGPPGRGTAPVAVLPRRGERRTRSSPPSPRRTTSPTSPSRSPTSRTSSASSTRAASAGRTAAELLRRPLGEVSG